MFPKITAALKRLTCRHEWEQKAWIEVETNNLRHTIRRYVCTKCGKISHQDSRHDQIQVRQSRAGSVSKSKRG